MRRRRIGRPAPEAQAAYDVANAAYGAARQHAEDIAAANNVHLSIY